MLLVLAFQLRQQLRIYRVCSPQAGLLLVQRLLRLVLRPVLRGWDNRNLVSLLWDLRLLRRHRHQNVDQHQSVGQRSRRFPRE